MNIPRGWAVATIGEVAQLGSGTTPSRTRQADYFDGGTIPWVKTGDLNNGVVTQTDESITPAALRVPSCKVYPKGTLLVAMYGGFNQIGRTGLLGVDAAINQALTAIALDSDKASAEYVLQWLNHMVGHWRRLAGSSRKDPNITKAEVAAFPLLLPSKAEQQLIVSFLSVWDRGIRQLTDLIGAKEKIRQGLMQQLLTGRRRFPSSGSTPWIRVSLAELLKAVDRYVDWDDSAEYKLVSIRRRSGGMFFRESKYGHEIKTQVMKVTHTGDFVIARMQAVHGAMAITPAAFHGCHISDSYSTFVARDPDQLWMPFLGYLSQTPGFYRLALLSAYGVSIEKMTFNVEWFLSETVLIPPSLEEQKRIADVLQGIDTEVEVLQKQLIALQRQKKGLMQKLLTGQVRVGTEERVAS